MKKRIMAGILAILMLVGNTGLNVFAEEIQETAYVENNELEYRFNSVQPEDCLTTYKEVVEEVRKQLVQRNEKIEIYYKSLSLVQDSFVKKAVEEAMQHTGKPEEGDFLRIHVGKYTCSVEFLPVTWGGYRFIIRPEYYSNARQEAELDAAVQRLNSQLSLDGKTDVEKVKSIYEYIYQNVSYDYEHMSEPYFLKFTAYAALVNKTAVFEGYAALFYRLMLENGISCRIIYGSQNGTYHAWNIVKLGTKFFNVDIVSDLQSEKYATFLKCNDDLPNHKRYSEYDTKEFNTQYPMASYNYLDEAEASGLPFTDVDRRSWYYNAVEWAYAGGYMSGTSATTFSPNEKMTRGMLVTILYRMAGRPTVLEYSDFPDVSKDKYYAKAVAWAESNGFVSGYKDGRFGPEDGITREQLMKVLFLYADYLSEQRTYYTDLSAFSDVNEISAYALSYVKWAVRNGLLEGSGGKLNPKGEATRAQIAAILRRFEKMME